MSQKSSKLWVALLAVPLAFGAAAGGAFYWRGGMEDAGRAAAEDFLGKLGPGKDRKLAFAMAGYADAPHDEAAARAFEEKLGRLSLFEVTSPSCPTVQRESNFLNTFTMAGLQTVECSWKGGSADLMVNDGRVVSISMRSGGMGNESL